MLETSYVTIRRELLEGSFVFKHIMSVGRKKYRRLYEKYDRRIKYARKQNKNIHASELNKYYYGDKEMDRFFRDLDELSNKLQVEYGYLLMIILPNKKLAMSKTPSPGRWFITLVDGKINQTLPSGLYIRFKPPMSSKDWKKAREQAEYMYKKTYGTSAKQYIKIDSFTKEKKNLYLNIEKWMGYFYRTRTKGVVEEKDVVKAALYEATIAEKEIEPSKIELCRTKDFYYKTVRKFMLPSLSDLPELQSLFK